MALPNSFGPETTSEEAANAFASQIHGKTILTTGVSPGGIGAQFVESIARHNPKLLILAARDVSKADATAQAISSAFPGVQTRVLELDLGSQAQVRKAAAEVNAYEEPIHVLVNNAGVMACDYSTTKDGLESHFGTNHIGHFLFTNLILGKILAAGPGARVVNVSSDGHRFSSIRFDDPNFSGGETYHKWQAYGQSKTANILFSVSLAEKLGQKGLLAFSVHPGVVVTNLGRHMSEPDIASLQALDRALGNKQATRDLTKFTRKTLSQGAATHVVAAFDPSIADHNGAYLADAQFALAEDTKPYAIDKGNAERLWKISEEIVGETFSYE